jgi:hypothetical protein
MCDACAATIQRRVWVYNQSIAKSPMNAAKEGNKKKSVSYFVTFTSPTTIIVIISRAAKSSLASP